MKISAGRIDRFCANPDAAVRIVLLYGPNEGLVRARAEACTRTVAGDLDDAFRVRVLDGAALTGEGGRLLDAASSLSLTGGRVVVRVRGAGDVLTRTFEACLARPACDNLIVAEAGPLPPRSSLRKLCEREPAAAALACYEDDADGAAALIESFCAARSLALDSETAAWLAERLGTDRRQIESEMEKLAVYLGGPEQGAGALSMEVAQAAVGDAGQASADEIASLAAAGRLERLDRAITRAFYMGVQPISILRAAARRLSRLHLAAASGGSPAAAMRALRPPVYPREQDAFAAQMARWKGDSAARAVALLVAAERECKSARGTPEDLCRDVLLRIALRGRPRRA